MARVTSGASGSTDEVKRMATRPLRSMRYLLKFQSGWWLHDLASHS